jgi:hypothetical protein
MTNPDRRIGSSPKNKIVWSAEMLELLDRQFPNCFNDQIAKRLKLSVRTIIRKARERGLKKVEGFEWGKKANARRLKNRKPNATKGQKGWCVPGGEKHRFGMDNPPPLLTRAQRNKAVRKRTETMERDRLRLKYGLSQLTKLKLSLLSPSQQRQAALKRYAQKQNPFQQVRP